GASSTSAPSRPFPPPPFPGYHARNPPGRLLLSPASVMCARTAARVGAPCFLTLRSRPVPLALQPFSSFLQSQHDRRDGEQHRILGERERRQTEDVPERRDENEEEQE